MARFRSILLSVFALACAVLGVAPAAQAQGAFAPDDFDSCGLAEVWTLVRPQGLGGVVPAGSGTGESFALFVLPAEQPHDAWGTHGTNGAVRLMQPASDVDFEIEARFASEPVGGHNDQGLLIEQDTVNWLRFDVYHDGTALYAFVGKSIGGTTTDLVRAAIASGEGTFLKLRRTGNDWTALRSADGENWNEVAAFSEPLTVTSVGLYAANAGGRAWTALVDYVIDPLAPLTTEDATCDDGNPCTADGWDSCMGGCANAPVFDPATQCCDPETGTIFPLEAETCGNGIDDDCDGSADEGCVCGDGSVAGPEPCDDGNALLGDGCRPDCTVERCGDAILDPGEECDDGGTAAWDSCQSDCRGDVFLRLDKVYPSPDAPPHVVLQWTGEYPRFVVSRSHQDAASIGDATHVVDTVSSYLWDEPWMPFTAGAVFFYAVHSLCGNGALDAGEACDDGNNQGFDGCPADCSREL